MRSELKFELPALIRSGSEDETRETGKNIARLLKRGDVVLLYGELGSGKTRLVQGICEALRVKEAVVSPTFTIINQYTGCNGNADILPVYHIDCYRITSADDLRNTGIDESISSDGICMIEWPQVLLPLLNHPCWVVDIEYGGGENERIIRVRGPE